MELGSRIGKKDVEEMTNCDSGCDIQERPKNRNDPEEKDRISALPDEILLHILSRLFTEDAVRTGTLSKRWLYLWTCVSNLFFEYLGDASNMDFVTFVDQTLNSNRSPYIRKFEITCKYNSSLASSADRWVRFASRRNVEEFVLDFHESNGHYELPAELICSKSLKSLTLSFTSLSDDAIDKILSGSPVLENLELGNCRGFQKLKIGSMSLRKLVINGFRDPLLFPLEISSPNLVSLRICGFMRTMILLGSLQSLVDCDLTFPKLRIFYQHVDNRVLLRDVLNNIRHVEKLTIGGWCINALSSSLPFLPLGCKSLILKKPIKDFEVPKITRLLEKIPHLETLVIDMSNLFSHEHVWKGIDLDYGIVRRGGFGNWLLHLKIIKVVHFAWDYGFELVKFLLAKARALEKMVINLWPGCSRKELHEVSQRLFSLPKSSPRATIFLSICGQHHYS